MRNNAVVLVLLCLVAFAVSVQETLRKRPNIEPDQDYQIGTAITDITGPCAEEELMGYAKIPQFSSGLHMRLWCRAYILKHKLSGTTFVFVNTDTHATQALKLQIVENLRLLHPDLYALYNLDNIILSSTHTHSGPGGYSWEVLYSISSVGFDRRHFNMLVDQIVNCIVAAHQNMSNGGRVLFNQGYLFDTNINRSPTSYLLNPEDERAEYKDQGDTDKLMTMLRFEDDNGKELGVITWFPVHPTSLNNSNTLVSSDNKGYAEYLFEKLKNSKEWLPGAPNSFIASFAQTNEGDCSPNTKGTSCPDGTPCESIHSTCGGKVDGCTGKGPAWPAENLESLKILGENQFKKALELYNTATRVISGPIRFRHTFVEMQNTTVSAEYTSTGKDEKTCQAALGYSFAGGTTDGTGWHFVQGDNSTGNWFWNVVRQFIAKPTAEQIACQYPKPILLDVGLTKPYPWVPSHLPVQMVTIGKDIVLMAESGEFTTMSGRRLKKRILSTLKKTGYGDDNTIAILATISNGYSQYVTTYEEYQAQRYEGASTLYGPHTLAAYIQEFDKLAIAISSNIPVPPGQTPRNSSASQIQVQPGVIVDTHPIGSKFGAVHVDAKSTYQRGQRVIVQFWGAHLKNDYMTGRTFMTVEKQQQDGSWSVVRTDADFSTIVRWHRSGIANSLITIEWRIESDAEPGVYRIQHFGAAKTIAQSINPYSGATSSFTITA